MQKRIKHVVHRHHKQDGMAPQHCSRETELTLVLFTRNIGLQSKSSEIVFYKYTKKKESPQHKDLTLATITMSYYTEHCVCNHTNDSYRTGVCRAVSSLKMLKQLTVLACFLFSVNTKGKCKVVP